jgi:ribosomal peptide maturation radical SAM protein 1
MPIDVRFVLTPFLPVNQPALGVSSLAATLEAAGYTAGVTYLNLDYLRRTGEDAYQLLAKFSQVTLLGEVIFARALWGPEALPFDEYWSALEQSLDRQANAIVTNGEWKSVRDVMRRARPVLERLYDSSPALVEEWAEALVAAAPRVIGFSSSFQQNVATLALAQAVRRLDSERSIRLAMGGANCEGEMGRMLAARFPFLDAVVSGEAEPVIVSLIERITGGRRDPLGMHGPENRLVPGAYVQSMDGLPIPAFQDYFRQAERVGLRGKAHLAAESARGCWWGAKAHCKFCGLNGDSMAFRAKSGSRTVAELRQLREQYGISRFMMTDNILDMKYFESMLPMLEQDRMELFYEIKSNLKREQVGRLARAGVRWVQPGVESLDTGTLRLIAKGVSSLQNIQLLKWCKEAGIQPFWSILYGFPYEEAEALNRMADLCSSLCHLPAPMQVAPFQLHRFSPYYFDSPRYGIEDVRPAWGYRFAYPGLTGEELSQVAYCFEFDCADARPPRAGLDRLFAAVGDWMSAGRRNASLSLLKSGEPAVVYDSRRPGVPRMEALSAFELRLLEQLGQSRGALHLSKEFPHDPVEAALERFRAEAWIVELDSQVLSLVLDYSWAAACREESRANYAWM